ncbi:MAG: sugar phosphate isomerase/epimerase [Caldilineaceae bacterium SB0670_bin_27]|uniref:Sugar phosphate isomerase/epimerase n=1 Tax=Caldilineaceae bacterium SB0664_bin_27 TaxID=2605260 RepID=A0A6B0YPZ1_9CHLR|nr:sugar phosphate isomerase/epimerase [Caldilineaceae bacterium SB0664_bin_27]MYJ77070.1 sugar phosphate isomerase/epimerase [Caldilineaceae bacterium SB0670_bin_27]
MFPNFSPGPLGINVTFSEAVQMAVRHGFGGLDVSIAELQQIAAAQGADAIGEQMAQSGLQFGIWTFPFPYRAEEDSWRQGLAEFPARAELARSLGAVRTSTFIAPADDERTWEENYEFHLTRLRPVARILADHGIRFGLEWVGPKTLRDEKKYPFIHTMKGAQQLAADLGTGEVGLLVDIFHLFTSHTDVSEVRNLTNKQVVNVHVNDAVAGRSADEQIDFERTLPAETGLTDIAGFLQALDAIGYDGPVTVEPFSQRIRDLAPEDAAQATADSLNRSWQLAGLSQ